MGKVVQFGSIPSLFPGWNPNWKTNLSETGLAIVGKGGGTFASGIHTGTEQLTTLSGTTTVASSLELGAHAVLGVVGQLASVGTGLATGVDVLAHAGCSAAARQDAGQMTPLPAGWGASL